MNEWKDIELGDFLTFQRGFDIVKRDMKEDGSYDVIFSSGFGGKHNEFKVEAPGVVIGRKGTLGSVFYSDTDFWPTDTTLWVKDFHGNNPKFAYYFLPTLKLEQYDCGSANPTLNRNHIHSLEVRIPESPKKQAEIAAVLSSLDRKIENLRRQNETLEAIAQTLFKHWFVNFEFPNADGKPYKSSGGAMEPSELGAIPAGWHVGKFADFFHLFSGGTPKTTIDEYWDGNIQWLSAKDVTSHHKAFILSTEKTITTLGLDKSAAKLLPKYTMVVSARGTVGNYCVLSEQMAISQSNFGVISRNSDYLFFGHLLIMSLIHKLKREAYGSVFDTITTSNFKRLNILVPDVSVLQNFESFVSRTFEKTLLNEQQIQTLTKTRDVLLPKLMSGKLRIKP